MRTLAGTLITKEQLNVLQPNFRVKAFNEFLQFGSQTALSGSAVDISVPQDIASDGTNIYAVYTNGSGVSKVKYIDPSSLSNFALTSSGTTVSSGSGAAGCLRPQLSSDGGSVSVFDVIESGGKLQLRSALLSGQTSNPLTLTWNNYGPSFYTAFISSSTVCLRVETVCPVYDACVVVVGYHDVTNQRTTLICFYVTTSTAVRLPLIVQDEMTLGSLGAWYANNLIWTHCCAFGSQLNTSFCFNTQVVGNSDTVTIKNGVCSARKGVMPIDPEQSTHRFLGHSMTVINGTAYLAGRFKDIDSDGTTIAYDGYAITTDGATWSIAARGHYVTASSLKGCIVARFLRNELTTYYTGNGYVLTSEGTPYTHPFSTASTTDITIDVISWNTDHIIDGADTLTVSLLNPYKVGGSNNEGVYDNHARVRQGGVLSIEAGVGGEFAMVGLYSIDDTTLEVSSRGRGVMQLRAREQTGKKLADVHMPVDVQVQGRYSKRFDLSKDDLDGLTHKTSVGDFVTGANGLSYKGLNTPAIFYLDAPHRDGWVFATAIFKGADPYHRAALSFLFEVTEDDNGYPTGFALAVPKAHNWSGHTTGTPLLRKLALPSIDLTDKQKDQTGFNLVKRLNVVLENVGTGGNMITAPATCTYNVQKTLSGNGVAVDDYVEFAFCYRGNRVSVYTKGKNLNAGSVAQSVYSQWVCQAEVLLDGNQRWTLYKKRRLGIMLSQDVWVDTGSLEQVEYGDMELTLTNAQNLSADADNWGYASSAVTPVTDAGTKIKTLDPGAIKLNKLVAGYAAFVSTDNTAFKTRYVESDGVRHNLKSDGGEGTGWGTVNPIPAGSSGAYGSEPGSWRMLLHHGRVRVGSMADVGLPDGNSAKQYILIDDEIIRYRKATFVRPSTGGSNTITWTIVPVYYAVLAAMSNSNTFTQWSSGGGSPAYPGDRISAIPDLQGLLVELTARNVDDTSGESTAFHANGTVTSTQPDTFQIDKTFPGTLGATEALAIISGRGQFSTKKEQHEAAAPVLYAPVDSIGVLPTIELSKLAYFGGQYVSVQDVLGSLAQYAGVNKVGFRAAHTNAVANTWGSITITSSLQSLSLRSNVADFVLDLKTHIPGNGLGSSAAERRLNIDFRNYYRLVIQQLPTAADCAAGRFGMLSVGLQTTSSDITADGNGDKWFSRIPIALTDASLTGAVSGSGANWSTTEDMSMIHNLRLAVQNDVVVVDMDGVNVFTFDLQSLKDGGHNYIRNEASGIFVSSSTTISSWFAQYWVSDLDESVDDFVIQQNEPIRGNVDTLTHDRHVWSRAMQPDSSLFTGVHFDRFWIRDNVGTMKENMLVDTKQLSDSRLVSHVRVAGKDVHADVIDAAIASSSGYKFELVSNQLLTTTVQCRNEALLWLREQQENALTRIFQGFARLEAEPGDKGTFGYQLGPWAPTMADEVYTILSCAISATLTSLKETYNVRRYVAI